MAAAARAPSAVQRLGVGANALRAVAVGTNAAAHSTPRWRGGTIDRNGGASPGDFGNLAVNVGNNTAGPNARAAPRVLSPEAI